MEITIFNIFNLLDDEDHLVYLNQYPVNENFYALSFQEVRKIIPQISIFEIELLIGSKIIPKTFYLKGEVLESGTIVKESSKFPKLWKIGISHSLSDLRTINENKLLRFQQIESVEVLNNLNNKKMIRITTSTGNIYYSNPNYFSSSGYYGSEIQKLVGAYLSPVFYKKGEKTFDDILVEKDATLVAYFNIRKPKYIQDLDFIKNNFKM